MRLQMKIRIKFLIEPHLQFQMVAFSAALSLIFLTIFGFAQKLQLNNLFETLHKGGQQLPPALAPQYFEILQNQEIILIKTFYLLAAIIVIFSCILGIIFSHKFAGPLYRIRMHFKTCAEKNELTPIKFRKGDLVEGVARSINDYVESTKK